MEILPALPTEAGFRPLAEHQSQTPVSFYNGPPILYLISSHITLLARRSDLLDIPAFTRLAGIEHAALNGHTEGDAAPSSTSTESDLSITDIDVWVTSEKLLLVRQSISKAISIPYPSIALHAVSSLGLYLQLVSVGGSQDQAQDDTENLIEVTLQPPPSSEEGVRTVDSLYQALSACADLHPDPQDEDSEDGDQAGQLPEIISSHDTSNDLYEVITPAGESQSALPPPMPGSSGWITAENVDQYFDADGNWKGPVAGEAALGPGAGTVRVRESDEQDGADEKGNGDESKWQRTD